MTAAQLAEWLAYALSRPAVSEDEAERWGMLVAKTLANRQAERRVQRKTHAAE